MIRGIHHVALNTPDIDRLVAFYRDVVGFEVIEDSWYGWENDDQVDAIIGVRDSAARAVMLRAANVHIEIFQYAKPAARGGDRLRPQDHGYTHLCLDVDDAFADYERLKAAGMEFPGPPIVYGDVITIYGRDPDGNVIEMQQTTPTCVFALDRLGLPGIART